MAEIYELGGVKLKPPIIGWRCKPRAALKLLATTKQSRTDHLYTDSEYLSKVLPSGLKVGKEGWKTAQGNLYSTKIFEGLDQFNPLVKCMSRDMLEMWAMNAAM